MIRTRRGYKRHVEKIQLGASLMVEVGKYFETINDYINIMKVCKIYKDFVSLYRFNPISDTTLFGSIVYQHFYRKGDDRFKERWI